MNAILFSQFFPPEANPGANRMLPLALALHAHFDLTVVTLLPSYPSPANFRDVDIQSPQFPFPVRRGFHFHPHRGGIAFRALRELWMSCRLVWFARLIPASLVLATSPSMFLGPAALALARKKCARFLWDIRDVTWQYAAEHDGGQAKTCAASWLKRWMLRTAQAADLICCANPGIACILSNQGVAAESTLVVPNGVAPEFLASFSDNPFPPANGQPVVAYIGVLGLNQGLRSFVEAAALVPEARFLLVGEGPQRKHLETLATEQRLRNVVFTGFIRGPRLLEAYRQSDILFAQLRDRPTLADGAWPSKLFEYMAACRPIVYAARGQAAVAVSQVKAGLVVPPEDPSAIARAIRELLASAAKRETMARNGRRHVVENCHREKIMAKCVDEIRRRFC